MESIKIEGEARDIQSVKYDLKYDVMQRNYTSTNIRLKNYVVFEEYGFIECDNMWPVRWPTKFRRIFLR